MIADPSSATDGSTSKRFEPGSFGCHELLHTTSLIAGIVRRDIVEHPSCKMNPEWTALAEEAGRKLDKLYQAIGREHIK